MDPLADELDQVRHRAHAAHEGNLSHVDAILARLEQARAHLVSPPPPPPSASTTGPPPDGPAPLEPTKGSSLGDDLLPLSTFLKTTNAQSAQLHKDWAAAISRLAKSADKVRPFPPLKPCRHR